MRLDRRLLWGFLPLVIAIAAWLAVRESDPEATWLRIESPDHAEPGKGYPVRLTLTSEESSSAAPMFLGIHLHGRTSGHSWHGYVAGAYPQPIDPAVTTYEFEPVLPQDKASGSIFVLIFTSPTGRWGDRVAVAISDDIPVFTSGPDAGTFELHSRHVHQREPRPGRNHSDSTPVRGFLALGWLTCGWLFWRHRSEGHALVSGEIVLPLVAAIWELSPLEQVLGERARALANEHQWYELRYGPQELLTVALGVGVASAVMVMLRLPLAGTKRVSLVGMTLYFGVTLIGFLSLHRIDALLGRGLFSVPLIQYVQAGALLLALAGVAIDWRQRQSGRPPES